LKATLDAD